MKTKLFWSMGVASLLLAGTVFAQNAVGNQNKVKNVANCTAVEGNVTKRMTSFENGRAKKFEQYERMQTKVAALIVRLETDGYDVTQIQIDKVTLDQKIEKFETDYTTYLSQLGETKTYTCGKTEGEFKAKLGIARDQLAIVRADANAIRTFWTATLKPEILAASIQTITEGSN